MTICLYIASIYISLLVIQQPQFHPCLRASTSRRFHGFWLQQVVPPRRAIGFRSLLPTTNYDLKPEG